MAKKSVQETVQKKYPDFVEVVDGLGVPELEARLLTYAKEREKVEEAKEADEELAKTAELLKELKGPYSDATKAINLKSRYLISLIKEKGGNVD